MINEKLKMIANDIDGYSANVLYKGNKDLRSVDDVIIEMKTICEYMKAICNIMSNGKVEDDYLGIAEYINKL